MTFTLYYGTTLVDTETASVHGNGTVHAHRLHTSRRHRSKPIITGTYQWDASYGGDGNNKLGVGHQQPRRRSRRHERRSLDQHQPRPHLGRPCRADPAHADRQRHPLRRLSPGRDHHLHPLLRQPPWSTRRRPTSSGTRTYRTPTGYSRPPTRAPHRPLPVGRRYGGDGKEQRYHGHRQHRAGHRPARRTHLSTTPNATASPWARRHPRSPTAPPSPAATTRPARSPSPSTTVPAWSTPRWPPSTETAPPRRPATRFPSTGPQSPVPTNGTPATAATATTRVSPTERPGRRSVLVSEAMPSLTTAPNASTVTVGLTATTTTDTATLSGGYDPSGNITFTLFFGATLLDTEVSACQGTGPTPPPLGTPFPLAVRPGSYYQWDATYTGNTNNQALPTTGP